MVGWRRSGTGASCQERGLGCCEEGVQEEQGAGQASRPALPGKAQGSWVRAWGLDVAAAAREAAAWRRVVHRWVGGVLCGIVERIRAPHGVCSQAAMGLRGGGGGGGGSRGAGGAGACRRWHRPGARLATRRRGSCAARGPQGCLLLSG